MPNQNPYLIPKENYKKTEEVREKENELSELRRKNNQLSSSVRLGEGIIRSLEAEIKGLKHDLDIAKQGYCSQLYCPKC